MLCFICNCNYFDHYQTSVKVILKETWVYCSNVFFFQTSISYFNFISNWVFFILIKRVRKRHLLLKSKNHLLWNMKSIWGLENQLTVSYCILNHLQQKVPKIFNKSQFFLILNIGRSLFDTLRHLDFDVSQENKNKNKNKNIKKQNLFLFLFWFLKKIHSLFYRVRKCVRKH